MAPMKQKHSINLNKKAEKPLYCKGFFSVYISKFDVFLIYI